MIARSSRQVFLDFGSEGAAEMIVLIFSHLVIFVMSTDLG
jgi:hypothetical protein